MADQTLPELVRSKYPGTYDDISDADLDAKVRAKFPGVYDDIPKPTSKTTESVSVKGTGSDVGAVSGALVKPTGRALEALATSPTAAKTIGTLARTGTTIGALGHGIATGNIPEIIASPIAGWQAGKGGYFLGKGLQSVAAPVATALESAAPYVQGLTGVQGGLDLAQMDDPKRQDIGVLGIGTRGTAADQAAVMSAQIKALVTQGMSRDEAVKKVYNAWAKQLRDQR